MRVAVIAVLFVTACSYASAFAPKPLPDLVATGSPLGPLDASKFVLDGGESFAWNVKFHGVSIGRAEIAVGDQEVRSRFETNALASSFARVKYELVSVIDRNGHRPMGANELAEIEGEATMTNASFDGRSYAIGEPPVSHSIPDGNVHTLHSALGVIRGWAQPQARGGVLHVLVGGKIFKLVLSRPIPEDLHSAPAIKVSGRVAPLEGSGPAISFAMWVTNTPARVPLRVEVNGDGKTITAEMIDL
ncbi:MAG: DUF3108 domain-containing protein [Kofleriaceae bacterium]